MPNGRTPNGHSGNATDRGASRQAKIRGLTRATAPHPPRPAHVQLAKAHSPLYSEVHWDSWDNSPSRTMMTCCDVCWWNDDPPPDVERDLGLCIRVGSGTDPGARPGGRVLGRARCPYVRRLWISGSKRRATEGVVAAGGYGSASQGVSQKTVGRFVLRLDKPPAAAGSDGQLEIVRSKRGADRYRAYHVMVNGDDIGEVRRGQSRLSHERGAVPVSLAQERMTAAIHSASQLPLGA